MHMGLMCRDIIAIMINCTILHAPFCPLPLQSFTQNDYYETNSSMAAYINRIGDKKYYES